MTDNSDLAVAEEKTSEVDQKIQTMASNAFNSDDQKLRSARVAVMASVGSPMKHRAPVVIAPHSEQWRGQFREERRLLLSVLPAHFRLEHIGSTSVPGMPAKPIIDMMLGARSLSEIQTCIPELGRLGYEYMPQHELELPERRFFAKPLVRPRHFHLHAVVAESSFWCEHLKFRDLLREDRTLADDYAKLKYRLAQAFGDERDGYTNAKTAFIHKAIHGSGSSEA